MRQSVTIQTLNRLLNSQGVLFVGHAEAALLPVAQFSPVLNESSRQTATTLSDTNTTIAQLSTVAQGLQKEISRFKVQPSS